MFTKNQFNEQIFNPRHLVLILGQNRETRLMMKTLLEIWRYRTIEARNVGESVQRLANQSPDIIIFDADSAFSDALEDLSDLRRHELLKNVPVIFISSFAAPEYRKQTMAFGATHFFTKPLNYNQLEALLINSAAPENNAEDYF